MNATACVLLILTSALGSPKFRTRDAAHRALAGMGRQAMPALERATASPDGEVARRAEILLEPFAVEIADRNSRAIGPTAWPRRPWLSGCDGAMTDYLSEARKTAGDTSGPPDWPEYREATRLWVRSLLLQRRPLAGIRMELDRMAAEERWWILAHGSNYNPPLSLPKGH